MQRYLGIDTHSTSSTICVLSAAGKRIRQDVVETDGQAPGITAHRRDYRPTA